MYNLMFSCARKWEKKNHNQKSTKQISWRGRGLSDITRVASIWLIGFIHYCFTSPHSKYTITPTSNHSVLHPYAFLEHMFWKQCQYEFMFLFLLPHHVVHYLPGACFHFQCPKYCLTLGSPFINRLIKWMSVYAKIWKNSDDQTLVLAPWNNSLLQKRMIWPDNHNIIVPGKCNTTRASARSSNDQELQN